MEENPWPLLCVPDWFVKQEEVKIWYEDNYCCNDNEMA